MAISKGLRGTIGKLQEENRRLGESAQQGKVDGIEIKDKTRAGKEEMKILQRDIRELREKVHELEKENEMLQQNLKKKDRELERFQALETGEKSNNIIPVLFVFIFHISCMVKKLKLLEENSNLLTNVVSHCRRAPVTSTLAKLIKNSPRSLLMNTATATVTQTKRSTRMTGY